MDITLCSASCPVGNECHRHKSHHPQAGANPWQSWARFPDDHTGSYACKLFWPIDGEPGGEGQWLEAKMLEAED